MLWGARPIVKGFGEHSKRLKFVLMPDEVRNKVTEFDYYIFLKTILVAVWRPK